MGDLFSFAGGLALFVISILVMIAYQPGLFRDKATSLLGWAIFLAFAADAVNAGYWQIGVKLWGIAGFDRTGAGALGNYLDLIFKGLAAFAGWLHLKSLHERLPPEDKPRWTVLEMPWYPNQLKLFNAMMRRK